MGTTLIQNGDILTMEDNMPLFHGDLAIEDDRIIAVGKVPANFKADIVIDASDKVVMPGLINTHTHAAMTLLRSYADDMPLMDWLNKKIWPAEANLTAEDVYWGSMLAIAEMLKSGTTTFADMYFFMDQTARAVQETGIRAMLSRGMVGIGPSAETALSEAKDLYRDFHGRADGRITVMLGPHAPYTCPPGYLKRVIELADELQADIHIHLAETNNEVQDCIKQYGQTPVALMEQCGLFTHRVLAAHCVHLSPADIDIISKRPVVVAHNPASNMKLASGIAPIGTLLEAGVTVGIGTDGASSNNNLDMFEELHLAALLQKVKGNPLVLPAFEVLKMATVNGAKCLGLINDVGMLKKGMKADIIMVDYHQPHLTPQHDLVSLLAYAAGGQDVDTVMVNGEVLVQNKQFVNLDVERIMVEASDRAKKLIK